MKYEIIDNNTNNNDDVDDADDDDSVYNWIFNKLWKYRTDEKDIFWY